MPTFKLNSIDCVDQQESGADELYLAIRPVDGDQPYTFVQLGGGFEAKDGPQKYTDVEIRVTEKYEFTLYEGDGQFPNFAVDDKIETWYVQQVDPAGPLTIEGNNAKYLVDYDLI